LLLLLLLLLASTTRDCVVPNIDISLQKFTILSHVSYFILEEAIAFEVLLDSLLSLST